MHPFLAAFKSARPYLQCMALRAAQSLGIFEYLPAEPREISAALCATHSLASPHRVDALLRVLELEGWLSNPSQIPTDTFAAFSNSPHTHWGALTKVICTNQPLTDTQTHAQVYQEGMAADAARIAAHTLPRWLHTQYPPPIHPKTIDIGAGLGAWSKVLLSLCPQSVVYLADTPEVLALTRAAWPPQYTHQTHWLEGLFPHVHVEHNTSGFDLVFMCDLLHWYSPQESAALLSSAAALCAPNASLILKEFSLSGSPESQAAAAYFGLNMSIYSVNGQVWGHDTTQSLLESSGWLPERAEEDPENPGIWTWTARKGVQT